MSYKSKIVRLSYGNTLKPIVSATPVSPDIGLTWEHFEAQFILEFRADNARPPPIQVARSAEDYRAGSLKSGLTPPTDNSFNWAVHIPMISRYQVSLHSEKY